MADVSPYKEYKQELARCGSYIIPILLDYFTGKM